MTEVEVWRTANMLLEQYGVEAAFIASRRAEFLLAQSDLNGCSAWVRIMKAIAELERRAPDKGDKVH